MTFRMTLAALVALTGTGCSLTKPAEIQEQIFRSLRSEEDKGELVTPRRCQLHVTTLTGPLDDETLNQVIWKEADEQLGDDESRRDREANGLRIGRIVGQLPLPVEQRLRATQGPNKPDTVELNQPDGTSTDLPLAQASSATLMLNLDGSTGGRDYEQVKGLFSITATVGSSGSTTIRLVPEVHHGAARQNISAETVPSAFAVQQFIRTTSQEEEIFHDLACELLVRPGEALIIGCRTQRQHSLGSFLFTETDPSGDRVRQKVLMITAEPSFATDEELLTKAKKILPDAGTPKLMPIEPPTLSLFGRKGKDEKK